MSEDEKRERPLGAVPAVLVAVAGVALAGAVLSVPGLGGRAEVAAAQPSGWAATSPASPNGRAVTVRPTVQVATSTFVNPTVSQAYVTVSPGRDTGDPMASPDGLPPRDAPLPPSGTCPESVDLMRLPMHNPWDASTWPRRVTAVTLCRYEHRGDDPSEGESTLERGPVMGDLAVFAAALDKALPPVRPLDHLGCRIANPDPPHPIDIIFVTASGDTGKAYIMPRTLCDPPWPEDPERALEEAVDAVLGPPY
jgi:hypothetical protein